MAKNYDQATRVVRRIDGEIIITINPKEIREVFRLGPLTRYHVPINLKDLKEEYMSKKDIVRQGALKALIGKIRSLPAITSSSKEPFKQAYFNARAIEIYMTL